MARAASRASGRRQTWVALLRGVNLGARNKISMPRLRELLGELGHDDVVTYLQSGNVVFRSREPRDALMRAIERELRRSFGLDVSVVLRTKSELRATVAGNSLADRQSDPRRLLVTFFAEPPQRAKVTALDPRQFEPDEFRITRHVAYLHCPQGYGRSKLSNAFFEKELGVVATTRNWRTVTALAELAGA